MTERRDITVLEKNRPLTDEELSADLTPNFTSINKEVATLPAPPNDELRNNNEMVIEDFENVEDVAQFRRVEDVYPNDENVEEETAAEIAPQNNVIPLRNYEARAEDEDDVETRERSGMAVTGIILSVLSLFFLPYILGSIGIVLGYLGYRKGDHALGMWAIGLGVIGLLAPIIVNALF